MADLSGTLFIGPDIPFPTYPPYRFRLSDGSTRYSYSCEIEELNSVGYQGPLFIPEIKSGETTVWSPERLQYEVKPIDFAELDRVNVDKTIRLNVQHILEGKTEFIKVKSVYLDSYVESMIRYYFNLEVLLESKELLTFTDVPHFPPGPAVFEDVQIKYDIYYGHESAELKKMYEKYGVIFTMPLEFRSLFKVDSTWTLGSDPIPYYHEGKDFAFDFRKLN